MHLEHNFHHTCTEKVHLSEDVNDLWLISGIMSNKCGFWVFSWFLTVATTNLCQIPLASMFDNYHKINVRDDVHRPEFLRIYFKNVLSEECVKLCYLVIFNIIVSHIFPINFIKIHQVFQKIWISSSSILTIFMNFLGFLPLRVTEMLMTSESIR